MAGTEGEREKEEGFDRCGRRGPQPCLVAPEFLAFQRVDLTEQNLPKEEQTDPQINYSTFHSLAFKLTLLYPSQPLFRHSPRKSRQATRRHLRWGLRCSAKIARFPASGSSTLTRGEESTICLSETFWEHLDAGSFREAGEMPVLVVEIRALC